MRKYAVLVICIILLTVGVAFAQTPREPEQVDTNASVFTNIVVTGNDKVGVPGYIGLRSNASNNATWYLYVNNVGELFIASRTIVSASDTITTWQSKGTKVGSQ